MIILYKKIARSFPELKIELLQAGRKEKPEEFIKKTFFLSIFISIILSFIFMLIFSKIGINTAFVILILPITFMIVFFFLIKGIKAGTNKVIRDIDQEIIYAGRFMLIELKAGVPLFDTIKDASLVYKGVGKPFRSIIDKVNIGKPIEQALTEVIEITPSLNLRKLLWQITNSLRTGGNISNAISSIINQLAKEQIISIKAYSKKLNALVMFYLILAIIAPSLGVTISALISIFMRISLGLKNLLAIAFFIFLIQIMFLSIIRASRPGAML